MKEEIHQWLSLLEVWDLQQDRSAPMAQSMAAAQLLTALHPQAQANAGERPHLPVLLPTQHRQSRWSGLYLKHMRHEQVLLKSRYFWCLHLQDGHVILPSNSCALSLTVRPGRNRG